MSFRSVFSWSVFPIILGGTFVASLAFIDAGMEPSVAMLPGIVASFVLIAIFEHVYPHRTRWLESHGDVGVDVSLAVTSGATGALVAPGLAVGGAAIGGWLSTQLGSPLWPQMWPLAAQTLLALVVAELPKYVLHRIAHEQEWLWRFHATHHSAPRLYWLNAARFHPVDLGLDGIVGIGTLIVLGANPAVIALFTLVSTVHGFFQHANLPLRLGPLNWFFSMAELHRWHHSKTLEEANTNYGQNLIVWDIVFGTRFLPEDREPPTEIGIAGLPNFPMNLGGLLASPFRWRRVVREASG